MWGIFYSPIYATDKLELATYNLAPTNLSTIELRKRWLLSLIQPDIVKSGHPKYKTYEVLALTARYGCGPYAEYMASFLVEAIPAGTNDFIPEMFFALPPFSRYIHQYGNCLSKAQKDIIASLLARKQNLFGHGTTNHAIMQSASWYLLAQYFPDLKWHNIDGHVFSSIELIKEHKRLLFKRTAQFLKAGQYEMVSPTYAMVNLYCVLNLIDFAIDPEVKKMAEIQAIMIISALRAQSFHGVIVPPFTRSGDPQNNISATEMGRRVALSQQSLWYYYGEPLVSAYDLIESAEPFLAIMLALSNWVPPDSVLRIPPPSTVPYTIKTVTPTFSIWGAKTSPEIYGNTYISNNFAIGTGNLVFDPSGYNQHTHLFSILYRTNSNKNQIECYQPYWMSNQGEDAWSSDRSSSPFMQSYLKGKEGVLLFSIPDKDPWVYGDMSNRFFSLRNQHRDNLYQLAQCRIPNDVDELIKSSNWIFIRKNNTFIALRTLYGTNEFLDTSTNASLTGYTVFKVRQPKTAIYFRVANKTASLSFSSFQHETVRKSIKFNIENVEVSFKNEDAQLVNVEFSLNTTPSADGQVASIPRVLIDGITKQPAKTPVIESPFLVLDHSSLKIGLAEDQMEFSLPMTVSYQSIFTNIRLKIIKLLNMAYGQNN